MTKASSRLPRIGITTRMITPQEVTTKSTALSAGVSENYVRAIEAHGGLPLLIPACIKEATATSVIESLDGILFSGGEDVDPSYYHEEPHPKLGTVCESRDVTELALFRAARERKLPILGICRGSQLINVAMGGSLFQDLPSQSPGVVVHQLSEESHLPLSASTHPIAIAPSSRLASILSRTSLRANSSHHQAVKRLGSGLVANAWTDDKVIEGFEGTAPDEFLMGVQCHPERLFKSLVPEWRTLFEAFVAAAKCFQEGH